MTITVARTNSVPNFYKYEDALQRLMDRHYQLVASVFTDQINQMVLAEEGDEKQLTPVVELKAGDSAIQMVETLAMNSQAVVVSRYLKIKSSEEVGKIIETTRKDAARAFAKAQEMALGTTVEKIEVASLSGGIFKTRLDGRTTGIVRLNTNIPAETAKLTQIELLSGEEPTIGGNGSNRSKQTKHWSNMGDSLVRDGTNAKFNHINAEQIVPIDKPFIVNGESLRHPGDGSLGASIANRINCRCSATYDIAKVAKTRKKLKEAGKSVPKIPRTRVSAGAPARVGARMLARTPARAQES